MIWIKPLKLGLIFRLRKNAGYNGLFGNKGNRETE